MRHRYDRGVHGIFRVVAVSVAVTLAPGAAPSAAALSPAADGADEDPMQKFEDAEALYEDGDYDGAIRLLRELIREHADPVLYYNLGRAYEGAGELESAIDSYERYLDQTEDAPDAEAVRQRVAKLQQQAQAQEERSEESTAEPPTPVAQPSDEPVDAVHRRREPRVYLPWTLLGVGAAGLVAGTVLGVLSSRNEARAEDAERQVDAHDALQDARRQALGANISFAIGGVVALSALTWGIAATVRAGGRSDRAAGLPSRRVSPDGAGLRIRF